LNRFNFTIQLQYNIGEHGGDFIFNIHAAQTRHQTVVRESLYLSQALTPDLHTDPVTHTRFFRLQAQAGELTVRYEATVDLDHHLAQPAGVHEVPVARLPSQVLPYIHPSRYCESDRLSAMAIRLFGELPRGYARVQAVADWVSANVKFRSNSSTSSTTAMDTLVDGKGVCRDFAHLMIALCRGLSIPARFATGIDYGADPKLGPTDFHAFVEVYLGDSWYIFDPSGTAIPMGFVRFAVGRDAAEAAFATIFGEVVGGTNVLQIEAVPNAHGQLVMPQRVTQALSTDREEVRL
jgi:transglutaminase-like putative cysteine protease